MELLSPGGPLATVPAGGYSCSLDAAGCESQGDGGPRVYLDSILFGFSALLGRVALGRRQYDVYRLATAKPMSLFYCSALHGVEHHRIA